MGYTVFKYLENTEKKNIQGNIYTGEGKKHTYCMKTDLFRPVACAK